MRAMRRRLTAFLALFAMLAGLAMPVHAYAHLRVQGGMAADFCTSTSAPAAPAAPGSPHASACDACANCMPAGACGIGHHPPVVVAGCLHAAAATAPAGAALPRAHFEARAPPLLP